MMLATIVLGPDQAQVIDQFTRDGLVPLISKVHVAGSAGLTKVLLPGSQAGLVPAPEW